MRRLGLYVTKEEELESIYPKFESVTRMFEKMLRFLCFSRKMRHADRRRRLRATITTKRHVQMAPRTTQTIPLPPLLALFFRARVVIIHAAWAWGWVVASAMVRVEARTGV